MVTSVTHATNQTLSNCQKKSTNSGRHARGRHDLTAFYALGLSLIISKRRFINRPSQSLSCPRAQRNKEYYKHDKIAKLKNWETWKYLRVFLLSYTNTQLRYVLIIRELDVKHWTHVNHFYLAWRKLRWAENVFYTSQDLKWLITLSEDV